MKLDIASRVSLTDEDLTLRVTDVNPGERVIIWASAASGDGSRWEARATFEADKDGCVDPARQAPLSGTFEAVDPTGLLWSMAPTDGKPGLDRFHAPWDAFEVSFVVKLQGHESVHATIERRVAAPGVTCSEVHERGLRGTLFRAAGQGPQPALALFHGSGGGVAGLEPVAALLASHGYTSLVVGYFGVAGLPVTPCGVPLEALAAGVRWLQSRDGVEPTRVGVLGTSVGAEAVLALASWVRDLDVQAVVAVSPSSVVWQALAEGRPPAQSRWTLAGQCLPYVALASERLLGQVIVNVVHRVLGGRPRPLRTLAGYEAGLRQRSVDDATIPVERIAAPLLLIASRDDQVWPAAAMAEGILTRRHGSAFAEQDRLVVFPDAGHMTLHVPGIPTTGRSGGGGELAFGGSAAGDARATAQAWREILAFLGTHLGPATPATAEEVAMVVALPRTGKNAAAVGRSDAERGSA